MSKNPVPWPIEPHTIAKHALYRQYFSKWFPIMARGFKGNVTYAEGFSGPGIYTNGSPGSPVIALRTLIDDDRNRRRYHKMRLLFVDHDERCVTLLRERMAVAAQPVALEDLSNYGIDLEIRHGACVPTLENLLDEHRAWGRPMLVVLDTWGGGVPLDLVRRIARNPHSEVLITIQPQYFARFAEVDSIVHGDDVFGGKAWRQVSGLAPDVKARWVIEHYRDVIREAGFGSILDFELIDNRGQALYLVFGTDHRRGLQKMKEAMWEVDDVAGCGYRDPRDPDQQTLEFVFEPNTEPLKRLLLDELRRAGSAGRSVMQLREFALYQTVFKESQVLPALEALLESGTIETSKPGRIRLNSDVRVPQQC
ncbi:three-Cys-motif partner protein TcmP [Nocardia asiatica]|uniref:three-Cys-motif partner protein TcmP n=1 Tax=Nocardia asiatica TaxID=209252 RepID=UPI0024542845|nr:three-Cys-motif partner protein TcmP [Nocardia asiatica]